MNGVILKVLTGSAAVLYGATSVMTFLAQRKEKWRSIYPFVWLLAASVNASVIAINWIRNGYVPFVSMYQVLVLLSLVFGLAHLYVSRVRGKDLSMYFSAGSCIVSIGTTIMDNGAIWHFAPSLQSPFFVPHIFCYMVSYSLAAVAFVLVIRDFICKRDTADALETTRVLFPFMTAGLLLGALWANEVWGAYWSWDLKECWSLFAWMCYVCALHFGKQKKHRVFMKWFLIVGFIGVIVTFFFVNMMNTSSIHSYTT